MRQFRGPGGSPRVDSVGWCWAGLVRVDGGGPGLNSGGDCQVGCDVVGCRVGGSEDGEVQLCGGIRVQDDCDCGGFSRMVRAAADGCGGAVSVCVGDVAVDGCLYEHVGLQAAAFAYVGGSGDVCG